jgi:proteasome lid subunit RPN8/RPN11
MLRGFLTTACRWLEHWSRALAHDRMPKPELLLPAAPRAYRPIERVVLADAVADTLFEDFAQHRKSSRGDEEVGWVLLGLREEREVIVLATLPAGADREAGVAHVHFNSIAQAVACRIVRQGNRRLGIVGVVHTHPGSLRHPSDGDFQGDSLWVSRLRGNEGVFAIGTADGKPANGKPAIYPEHMQARGELCFSWYVLGAGDRRYRRVPVTTAPGPDLARPLHPIWDTIELHADALDGLCQQLAQISFEIVASEGALVARLPVADGREGVRILIHRDQAHFFLDRGNELTAIDPKESQLDRAVFLVLAELARQRRGTEAGETPASAEAHGKEARATRKPMELCRS